MCEALVSRDGCDVLMLAEHFEGHNRFLDHIYVIGSQNGIDYGHDGSGGDRKVARNFFDKRSQDMQRHLNIPVQ
ncbi:hypothetical protein JBE27_56175 [Streptomyces albiflaviniger]|nr:hypothetical protein [Streptomyces albiflaviniger]